MFLGINTNELSKCIWQSFWSSDTYGKFESFEKTIRHSSEIILNKMFQRKTSKFAKFMYKKTLTHVAISAVEFFIFYCTEKKIHKMILLDLPPFFSRGNYKYFVWIHAMQHWSITHFGKNHQLIDFLKN